MAGGGPRTSVGARAYIFWSLGGSYFFGVALLAEFLEEVVLAEGSGAVQQSEQQVFGFAGCLAALVVLVVAGGQRARRNQQLGQGSRTAGKKVYKSAALFALFPGWRIAAPARSGTSRQRLRPR